MERSEVVGIAQWDDQIRSIGEQEARSSGISWAAVIAGAFISAALFLILVALGAGLDLSFAPRAGRSIAGPVVWLIIIQIIAFAIGGYVAGRLRTKWSVIHDDEVYFRDTATGLLVWAVALVATAAFLASAVTLLGVIGDRSNTASFDRGATSPAMMAAGGRDLWANQYYIDMLFRSDGAHLGRQEILARGEAARIFTYSFREGSMSAKDHDYLSQVVAGQTGLGLQQAGTRVSDVFSAAQSAAKAMRKAAAYFALWVFVASLIGAFSASLAATFGGRERDRVARRA